MDWGAFLLGFAAGVGMEALIGAFVTAPLAVWWIRRKKESLIQSFLEDKELMGQIRNSLLNGMMGGLGGRPVKLKSLAKGIVGLSAQAAAPAIAARAQALFGQMGLKRKAAQRATARVVRTGVPTQAPPASVPIEGQPPTQ